MYKRVKREVLSFFKKTPTKNLLILGLAILIFLAGLSILWVSSLKIPDLSSFEDVRISQSTKIYDKTGQVLLYNIHKDTKRTIIPLEQISNNIKNATIAIEDSSFYQHGGIEIKSILRAILANLTSLQFSQGGSTITQQVVKNSILTKDKTITRKLKEWILSVKLEQVMSKNQILSLYLNNIPYGGSIYGVEEASEAFFNKKASDLTLAESAYIAAIPQAPTYYSPYGNHKDALNTRKNFVLKRMLENNLISEKDYNLALKEVVTFQPQAETGIKAPHFVQFVKEYLENKYGAEAIQNGGYKVITTLDYEKQAKAEEIAKKWASQNKVNFNAENASFVAVDSKTGQILVMVGSRDYFDKEIDGNYNIATAKRQPGSSFKPFVYSEAFLKGYRPETVVFDLPTEFSTYCTPEGEPANSEVDPKDCYMPVNYDGKYLGPVSLRDALAQSRNIPAIQVLYLAGLRDSLSLAKDFGIQGLGDSNQYGLTLVLGGGEVSLLDMTSAYSVFANDGIRNPYQYILEIDDANGNIIEKPEQTPTRVIPEQVARQISDILSDDVARAPEFGTNSALNFPGRSVAVKTGTTNDYRDAWVIGYTPQISVGAWAGNNDNSPMEKKIAGFIVAPMWHGLMNEFLNTLPNESFIKPDPQDTNVKPVIKGLWQGNIGYTIDKITGKLATDLTPDELRVDK
ncbi:penicillin-binding protein, partial [Candidatus Nomurabacteria bacterium]|nr:penicillin-binding protein [Candidatus Nomurabacteria bacterium]